MVFDTEAAFEEAVIEKLKAYGWDDAGGVLKYPTEQQLLDNWAAILFENNKHRDCLNGAPLTPTEMQQIVEKIREKRTPVAINELINGKEIIIKRDNANDDLHVARKWPLRYSIATRSLAGKAGTRSRNSRCSPRSRSWATTGGAISCCSSTACPCSISS